MVYPDWQVNQNAFCALERSVPKRLKDIDSYGLFVSDASLPMPQVVAAYIELVAYNNVHARWPATEVLNQLLGERHSIKKDELLNELRRGGQSTQVDDILGKLRRDRHSIELLAERSYVVPFKTYFAESRAESLPIHILAKMSPHVFATTKPAVDFSVLLTIQTPEQLRQLRDALNEVCPIRLFNCGKASVSLGGFHGLLGAWLFGPYAWDISDAEKALSVEEFRYAFLEALDKDRQKWERLKHKYSGIAGKRVEIERVPIPENVRIFVWRRDQGRCVQCGSNERLEFDHIIPLVKGGSNTERNIQLLCEPCNRRKSDSV